MTRPKLLLADDSVTIRKVVELTFADEGIDVITAGDAETAMQKFVEVQPDIVLVDIGLAGTNGYQICEMIKQDDATRHIPVLLLVGSFEPFDQDEAERAGADGFMTKPFHSIRDLVGRVSELLGLQSEEETETPDVTFDAATTDPTLEMEAPDPTSETDTIEPTPEAATEPFDVPARPEVADIEELYRNSFSANSVTESNFDETVEITDMDTMDDALGDSGMDDEMIEASYAGPSNGDNVVDFVSAATQAEDAKGFDWSPESMVTERPIEEATSFEPKFVFEETTEESMTIEADIAHTFEPETASSFEQDETRTSEQTETSPFEAEVVPSLEQEEVRSFEQTETAPFEPEVGSSFEEEQVNPDDASDETSEHETAAVGEIETSQPAAVETEPVAENNGASTEYSADLINLIAQRVIEKLSDKVIREVAQDAVPQIAEKLIREALEDETKH